MRTYIFILAIEISKSIKFKLKRRNSFIHWIAILFTKYLKYFFANKKTSRRNVSSSRLLIFAHRADRFSEKEKFKLSLKEY